MKALAVLLLAAIVAVAAYVAAGPFLTIHSIRDAVQANDSAALSAQVDFPALRASLKRQLADRLVRGAGAEVQSSVLGAIGIHLATGASSMVVDAAVNPLGLAALMQGRGIRMAAIRDFAPPDPRAPVRVPLQDASYRYESPSRFTATIVDEQGQPLVFVLERRGLDWQLADIRLPR
jgi:hypothetical protein